VGSKWYDRGALVSFKLRLAWVKRKMERATGIESAFSAWEVGKRSARSFTTPHQCLWLEWPLEHSHRIELAGASRRRNDATPRSKKSKTPATK